MRLSENCSEALSPRAALVGLLKQKKSRTLPPG